MREKIASIGTFISLSVLTLLLLAHALLIFPGADAVGTAARGLVRWLRTYNVTVADGIALVSALATVGAVFVALWLARSDRRRTAKESMSRAQLAAAGIATGLTTTLAWVSEAWAHTIFLDTKVSQMDGVLKGVSRTAMALRRPVFPPSGDTLIELTPLPNNCAHRIARAYGDIEALQKHADRVPVELIKIFEKTTPHEREALLEGWRGSLGNARDLLLVALAECNAATELGAPIPTAYEMHGEDIDW